jgi:hypothetical protein
MDYQGRKYRNIFDRPEMDAIVERSLRIRVLIDELVRDFTVRPVIRPSLPSAVSLGCPSSIEKSAAVVCDSPLLGPVVFRSVAKPVAKEYYSWEVIPFWLGLVEIPDDGQAEGS